VVQRRPSEGICDQQSRGAARRAVARAWGEGTALLEGRNTFAFEDIRAVSLAARRHRVILGFDADAEGITTDKLTHTVVCTRPED
jgi:hypothetical protein